MPPHCIPIHANVTTFDWAQLSAVASFDVVMMDPPWQLATANPTRGVALGYSQLTGERWRGVIEAAGGGGGGVNAPYLTVQYNAVVGDRVPASHQPASQGLMRAPRGPTCVPQSLRSGVRVGVWEVWEVGAC